MPQRVPHAKAARTASIGGRGVEDGKGVGGELLVRVGSWTGGPIGPAAAASVERDHTMVASEVGDLQFPVA